MPEISPLPDAAAPPKPAKSRTKLMVIIAVLVVATGLPILLFYAARNAKNVARDYLAAGAGRAIDASSLTAEEKADAKSTVHEFFTDAVADRIPKDKLASVFAEIMRGPYGKILELASVNRAIDKSNLEKDPKAEALDNVRIITESYVHKLISDAEMAPVIAAIPKNAQKQPLEPPWNDADLDQVLARLYTVNHTSRNLLQLAALQRAIDKSYPQASAGSFSCSDNNVWKLAKAQKVAALDKIRILSNAYAHGLVSAAQVDPVVAAIPKTKDGRPAPLPWKDETIERALAPLAAIGGPYAKLVQVAPLQHAVEMSNLSDDEIKEMLKPVRNLSDAYTRKLVSDAEMDSVIASMPSVQGKTVTPPWKAADLKATIAKVTAVLKGKNIPAEGTLPDSPEAIRRAVQAMKEALAAAIPATAR